MSVVPRSTPKHKRSLSSRANRQKPVAEVTQPPQGHTRIQKWQDDMLKKYGWYSHQVFPTGDPARDGDMGLEPGLPQEFFNAHTHGFTEKFGVPDVQIVLPLPLALTQSIFWAVHNQYAKRNVLAIGVPVEGVLANLPVMLVPAKDHDRLVHRIIVPDPQGLFWDHPDCEPVYKAQVSGLSCGFAGEAGEGRAAR